MQVIQERDGDDNIVATDIWDGNTGGLGARIVNDIVNPQNPPQKYFYHYDGSGNVTAVTDDSQQTVATYDYDAYGNLLNSSGAYASQNPWRFSTKYYDDGNGLYYYGYRFYSPGLGKWINRDPIEEDGGYNLYHFVANSPSNYGDRYGLFVFALSLEVETEVAPEAEVSEAPQAARTPRISPRTIRRSWEKFYGRKWPFDEVLKRYFDAHHKVPISEGGDNSPENIEPLRHSEHMQRHIDNGDFKRWGSMSKGGTSTNSASLIDTIKNWFHWRRRKPFSCPIHRPGPVDSA
jgi:RHS repeat-associated protein